MASYRHLPPRTHFRRSEVQSGIQLAPLAAFLTSLNTAQHLVKLGDILERYRTPKSYHRIDHRIVESSELPPSPSVFESEADTEKLERWRLELGEPIIDDDDDDNDPGREDENRASDAAGEKTDQDAPKAGETKRGDGTGEQANGVDGTADPLKEHDPHDLTAQLPLAEVLDNNTNPNDRSVPSTSHSHATAADVSQAEQSAPDAAPASHARRLTSVPLSRDASGAMALFYLSRGANEVPTTPDTLPSSEQLSEAIATTIAISAKQQSAAPAHAAAVPVDDDSRCVPNGFAADVDVGLSPPVDPSAPLSLPQLLNPLVEPEAGASQPLEDGSTLGEVLMAEDQLAITSDLTAIALANLFGDASSPLTPPESPVCNYPRPESGTARINREMRIDLRTLDPAALWALEVWRREVLELPALELVVPQSRWFVQPEPKAEPSPKKKGRPRRNPVPEVVDLTAASPPKDGAGAANGDLPNDSAGASGQAGPSSPSLSRTPSPAIALPIGFDGDHKDDDDFEPTPRRAASRLRGAPRGRPRGRGRGRGRTSALSDGGRIRTESASPADVGNDSSLQSRTPTPSTRTFARKLVSKHSIHLTAKHSGQSSHLEPPPRVPSRLRNRHDRSSNPLASMSDEDPTSVNVPQPPRSRHQLSSGNDEGGAPPPPARHLLSSDDEEAASQQQVPLSHQLFANGDVSPMPRPSRLPPPLSRRQLSSDDEDEEDTGQAGGSRPAAPGFSQRSGPRCFAALDVERDPSPDFIVLDFPPSPERPHRGPFRAFNPPPMAVAPRRTLPASVRERDCVPIISSGQSRSKSTTSRSFNRMETAPAARTRKSPLARIRHPEPALERRQTLLRPTKTASKKRRHDSDSDDASPPPMLEPAPKRMRQFIDCIEVPSRQHIRSSQHKSSQTSQQSLRRTYSPQRCRQPSESPQLVDDSSNPVSEVDELEVEPARKSPARSPKTVRKTVSRNRPSRETIAESPEPPRKALALSAARRKAVAKSAGSSWKVATSPQPTRKQVGRKHVGVQGAAMRFSVIAPALLKAQERKEEAARAARRLIEPDLADEEDEWVVFKV